MKNFAVLGLGNFGFNIARNLSEKGKNVLAIDSDPNQIEKIKNIVNDAIIGDIKNKAVLTEFLDQSIDTAIISTGDNEFDSILAVHHIKEIGVQNIIVKANNDMHAQILKLMGATEIIFPEKDIAEWIATRLSEPNLIERIPLSEDYSIVEYACPDKFAGNTLRKIQLRSKFNILLIAVKDILTNEFVLMPDADFKFKPDTILLLMGKKKDINQMKLKY
ncbi:MAG: TrkA family potassium uptake protein [Ignavibacteriales bacterium]|nr:TrkA family potassium uptake protein [Ignavibacteriales bacterium]MBK7978799.1 TrkA family potassium uptake protein [Ignavibacteriota bacterium]